MASDASDASTEKRRKVAKADLHQRGRQFRWPAGDSRRTILRVEPRRSECCNAPSPWLVAGGVRSHIATSKDVAMCDLTPTRSPRSSRRPEPCLHCGSNVEVGHGCEYLEAG